MYEKHCDAEKMVHICSGELTWEKKKWKENAEKRLPATHWTKTFDTATQLHTMNEKKTDSENYVKNCQCNQNLHLQITMKVLACTMFWPSVTFSTFLGSYFFPSSLNSVVFVHFVKIFKSNKNHFHFRIHFNASCDFVCSANNLCPVMHIIIIFANSIYNSIS